MAITSMKKLEDKFGLPPIREAIELLSGDKARSLTMILSKLEKLSKDESNLSNVIELLKLVKELDDKGTLTRLLEVLKAVEPLTKGQSATLLVKKLDGLERILQALVGDEEHKE